MFKLCLQSSQAAAHGDLLLRTATRCAVYLCSGTGEYLRLDLKKNTPELGMAPKIVTLDQYIEETLPTYQDIAAHMESKTVGWKDLNEFV